jgi:ribosomal protein L22
MGGTQKGNRRSSQRRRIPNFLNIISSNELQGGQEKGPLLSAHLPLLYSWYDNSEKRISNCMDCDDRCSCCCVQRQIHDSQTILRADEPTTINPLQQTPISSSANEEDVEKMLKYSPSTAGEKCARAVLRGAHIGPRKLNMFAALLRGLHVEDALIQCKVHHKKAARMCEKLLMSAKANAVTNHGLDGSKLKVKEAWVGKGQYLRRISIHGRGRSGIMHKYRSHLTVILKEEETPRRTKIVPMLQERTKWRRQPRTSQALSG